MKTKTAFFLILCLLVSSLSGCGTGGPAPSGGDGPDGEVQDDPFDYEGPSEILGSASGQASTTATHTDTSAIPAG